MRSYSGVFGFVLLLLFGGLTQAGFAQTDYGNLNNWAFHPNKPGTLIDGFNLNIAVINEQLQTTSIIQNSNNAMTNTGVDVFFIHPTILQNMDSYTTIENVPIELQNSFFVAASIRGQAGLLAQYGRMFAPRYRQATPPTFINTNTPLLLQASTLGIAYQDIKAAFLQYLSQHNNGNKIILASHSQGAYLAGFLLRDVFDNNPQLRQQLVVAVVAGMVSNYSTAFGTTGGWWEHIPFCTEVNECGCVMNWRSYKEGQTPPVPLDSHPCTNSNVISNGWAYSELQPTQNSISQDSLYYNNESVPLRNFITLRSNVSFGGNVGYVAFDSLYSIRHHRSSMQQVGFAVDHTPKPGDLRPNLLAAEESNPAFSLLGYHQRDYNIYTWALLEQINQKLLQCGVPLSLPDPERTSSSMRLFPNPARERVQIFEGDHPLNNSFFAIYDTLGKSIRYGTTEGDGGIGVSEIPSGLYYLKTEYGVMKMVLH